jgi:23S rRNA (uracil1939-C5)-methyltransferase
MEQNTPQNLHQVTIEGIDLDGKGIARIDGKTVFVDGVLPTEVVNIEIYKRREKFDKARALEIITKSTERVEPLCPNFGICGGCSLQHIDIEAQVKYKQQVLIDNLKHIGKVSSNEILPAMNSNSWGYRHRARMSSRYVAKKGGVLVGFHEKGSSFVANMSECKILPKNVSDLIPELRVLVDKLSIKDRVPQIEVAVGDKVTALVFRIMDPLNSDDEILLKEFADIHHNIPLQIWLQPKGPDTCYPFYPLDAPKLSYSITKFNLEMPYYPSEFTQVNPEMNNRMVELAINLLAPQENEKIADFFCGIGNFTLPIAKFANSVVGVEGSSQLVKRAMENAIHNQLDHKVSYLVSNLFKVDENSLKELGKFDKWLIDPPRDGAYELIKAITPEIAPTKIVYVSCNPATLARDADVLVNTHGYTLDKAGVMNMFPHTSHIESIAIFEKIL